MDGWTNGEGWMERNGWGVMDGEGWRMEGCVVNHGDSAIFYMQNVIVIVFLLNCT